MDNRIIILIMGIGIAIAGFAFAFSSPNSQWLERFGSGYDFLQVFVRAYPNFMSGVVIGISGIAIATTGKFFLKKSNPVEKSVKKRCNNCGQNVDEKSKYCWDCGASQWKND